MREAWSGRRDGQSVRSNKGIEGREEERSSPLRDESPPSMGVFHKPNSATTARCRPRRPSSTPPTKTRLLPYRSYLRAAPPLGQKFLIAVILGNPGCNAKHFKFADVTSLEVNFFTNRAARS